jgi:hypothetical protein
MLLHKSNHVNAPFHIGHSHLRLVHVKRTLVARVHTDNGELTTLLMRIGADRKWKSIRLCAEVRNGYPIKEYPASVFRQRVGFHTRILLLSYSFLDVFPSCPFVRLTSFPHMLPCSLSYSLSIYLSVDMDMYR